MLYIEQKALVRSEFVVTDELKRPVWVVKGTLSQKNGRLDVFANDGTYAASIVRNSGFFGTSFDISINNVPFELIKRKNTSNGVSYILTKCGWKLDGDFMKAEYRILTAHNGLVMSHNKMFFSWGETYSLNASRVEDELMGLCIALAIDCSSEI